MARNNVDIAVAGGIAVLGCATIVVHFPAPVMVIIGVGLFGAPGYVWSEVLLSHRVTPFERILVAISLALMVPIFGGLALYAAGILLHRTSWVGLLTAATSVGAAALAFQRRGTESPAAPEHPKSRSLPVPHVLAFGAAALIAMGAVTVAVLGAEAQKYPGYTQLWLSPLKSEPLRASLGVTNQQGSRLEYRVVLLQNGRVSASWNITLVNGQTWQRTVPFTTKYLITADLFRLPNLSRPYREVDNGG
jgi:hypothetical protein